MSNKQVKLEVTIEIRYAETKEDERILIKSMKESILTVAHYSTKGTVEVRKVVIKK